MPVFIILTFTLLSAAFSLGGVAYLYIRYRTRLLRLVLLFLLSLLFITAGFWISLLKGITSLPGETGTDAASWIFQLLGGGLNIAVLPYFASALVLVPLPKKVKAFFWCWNILFIFMALTVFLFPRFSGVLPLLSLMQVLTILGAIIFIALGFKRMENTEWKKALVRFLIASGVFLILLMLDMLVTLLPIKALAWFDNLSMPVYLITITGGAFFFAGRFLSREALVKAGSITPDAKKFYGLSDRETQIVENLLAGYSNKEIGSRLFISPKTVENHLYNIYRKLDVGSRTQLIGTLWNWERQD